MEKKSVFNTFLSWLKSSEMFMRPSKQLPGKWNLYEYYYDSSEGLLHFDEAQLKANNESWTIQFNENNFTHQCNLPLPVVSKIENGAWGTAQNYLTLIHPADFRNNVEFQFAIEKGKLKLLKKDTLGKIEIFGFFTKSK